MKQCRCLPYSWPCKVTVFASSRTHRAGKVAPGVFLGACLYSSSTVTKAVLFHYKSPCTIQAWLSGGSAGITLEKLENNPDTRLLNTFEKFFTMASLVWVQTKRNAREAKWCWNIHSTVLWNPSSILHTLKSTPFYLKMCRKNSVPLSLLNVGMFSFVWKY